MATRQRTNRNPYMSANLGSGARTTTGGTYENPRLGIEDYTAFGRGVGSTFRVPEQKETQQLEGGIDYFGADQDAILGGLEFKENSSLVKNFTNGPLAQMQAQYAKCSRANDQRCLQNISNDLGLYQTGQNNFRNLIQNYADGEVYDPETSKGRFLIDVNGNQIKKPDGGFLTISDLTKVNNDNPQDMNIGVALNKNGDKKAVYQFKMDGQTYTTNLSDLTDSYLKSSFDVRSDIGLNVQTAMTKDGSTFGWKDEPKMFERDTNITTEKGNISVTNFEGFEKIVNDEQYFADASTAANTFSSNLYKTNSSPGNNSAFNALAKRLYNDDFTSNVEGYTKPTAKDETDFINELKALPNDVKLAMLRDEGVEEWKIKNASKGHRRGDDGRALPLNEELMTSEKLIEKPIDEDDGSGGGGVNKPDRSRIDRFFRLFNKGLEVQTFGKNVSVEGKPGFVINESAIENFFQEYQLPIGGADRKVGGIEYFPDRYGKGAMPGDAGLGTLKVMWVKSGDDDEADEEITYDLNDEGSVLKLVSKMKRVGGSSELTPAVVTGIVNEFQRLKDVVKGGSLRDPSEILASRSED
jgi:hypothetical protein